MYKFEDDHQHSLEFVSELAPGIIYCSPIILDGNANADTRILYNFPIFLN